MEAESVLGVSQRRQAARPAQAGSTHRSWMSQTKRMALSGVTRATVPLGRAAPGTIEALMSSRFRLKDAVVPRAS